MSVTVTLKDHLDISRGDMLCRPHNIPTVAQEIDAQVCWMDESAPMTKGGKYAIKHTTRWARALVRDIAYRIDVNTLHRDETSDSLVAQRDRPRAAPRRRSRCSSTPTRRTAMTGSFILVDERSNKTVGAGVIGRATTAA